MPVHFSGLPVDMDALYALAASGACAWSRTRRMPSARAGAASPSAASAIWWSSAFIPNKNMTSIEGGAIATADAQAAALFEQYRFHGIKRDAQGEIDVMFPGAKSNLTDVAAQIGIDQLRRLDALQCPPPRARRALLRGARGFPRSGVAGARRRGSQLAHVSAADRLRRARHDAAGLSESHGGSRHRHRRALSLHSGAHAITAVRATGRRTRRWPRASAARRVTLPLFPAMQDEDVARVCRELREVLG